MEEETIETPEEVIVEESTEQTPEEVLADAQEARA